MNEITNIRAETSELENREQENNQTKSGLFEKIMEVTKLWLNGLNKDIDDSNYTKIKNESRDISTNLTEIKKIIRGCYEQLYTNYLHNLDEMDKFLVRHKLLKLIQVKQMIQL